MLLCAFIKSISCNNIYHYLKLYIIKSGLDNDSIKKSNMSILVNIYNPVDESICSKYAI